MTPEMLKGLYEWLKFSYELVGPELEDYQKSRRPKGVSDAIVESLIASRAAPAPPSEAQISKDPSGSWNVEGLDMIFLTRADAEVAAEVMARVQEIERTEGRPSQ